MSYHRRVLCTVTLFSLHAYASMGRILRLHRCRRHFVECNFHVDIALTYTQHSG